ncbi:hypothetical protein DFJ74DRAFT_767526 [Hyaloraphidium curvatum]|nr:hypothetical protein DFJ74DRAFT_767526 [Hyaloraphidium curvatum]
MKPHPWPTAALALLGLLACLRVYVLEVELRELRATCEVAARTVPRAAEGAPDAAGTPVNAAGGRSRPDDASARVSDRDSGEKPRDAATNPASPASHPPPAPQDAKGYVPHADSRVCSPLANRRHPGRGGKRVVSFSLFALPGGGVLPFLVVGIRKNYDFVRLWYPGWTMRVYAAGVNETVLGEFERALPDAEFVRCRRSPVPQREMEYRWLPYDDAEVERFVVRDLDSLPGPREAFAVGEWEASRLPFHAMRDHEAHGVPLVGCCFGIVAGTLGFASMEGFLEGVWGEFPNAKRPSCCGEDQGILMDLLWPKMRDRTLSHDSSAKRRRAGCYGSHICRDFPITERTERGYVGLALKDAWRMERAEWECSCACEFAEAGPQPSGYEPGLERILHADLPPGDPGRVDEARQDRRGNGTIG